MPLNCHFYVCFFVNRCFCFCRFPVYVKIFILDLVIALVVKYISLVSTECFFFVFVQNIHLSCWVLLECFFSYLRALVYSSPTNQHFYPNWRIGYLFSECEGPLEHLEKTRNLSMAYNEKILNLFFYKKSTAPKRRNPCGLQNGDPQPSLAAFQVLVQECVYCLTIILSSKSWDNFPIQKEDLL